MECANCIHCEVCGLIESEVARIGACDFYEDGKRWKLTKEEKALLQKWRDNRGISMKDFEDAMDALEQEPKFIAKSDGTIEQIKNCDDCIFRKEWEKIGKLLSVILKKQTEQEPILDKIRAEIDQKQYDFMADKDYDEGIRFGLMLAHQIIDKHKAERSDKE